MSNIKFDDKKNQQTNHNSSPENLPNTEGTFSGESIDKDIIISEGNGYTSKSNANQQVYYDRANKSLIFTILVYAISFIVALGIAFLIASSSGAFKGVEKQKLFGILSDSCLAPGAFYICIGLLLKISETGFFDSISFILKRVFLSFIPGARIKQEPNFKEYKKNKEERRKKARYSSIFFTGIFFILLSILFLILYSYI